MKICRTKCDHVCKKCFDDDCCCNLGRDDASCELAELLAITKRAFYSVCSDQRIFLDCGDDYNTHPLTAELFKRIVSAENYLKYLSGK